MSETTKQAADFKKQIRSRIEAIRRGSESRERRNTERHPYAYRQLIAPYCGAVPSASEFVEVTCRDISVTGLAFFWPQKPTFERVIIALGVQPQVIQLTGRIVRTQEMKHPTTGRLRYLVGCRFLGRLEG